MSDIIYTDEIVFQGFFGGGMTSKGMQG